MWFGYIVITGLRGLQWIKVDSSTTSLHPTGVEHTELADITPLFPDDQPQELTPIDLESPR